MSKLGVNQKNLDLNGLLKPSLNLQMTLNVQTIPFIEHYRVVTPFCRGV